MAINFRIPVKNRFFTTSTLFSTVYNAFTFGRYDFASDPGCQNIVTFPMEPENTYLINQISVGGIISEQDYLASIDVFPHLTIKRSKSAEPIYQQPFPIVGYYDGVECSAFVKTELVGEGITLSLSGKCRQLPSMVGLSPLQIIVTLSVFSIANTDYNKFFDKPIAYTADTGM